MFSRSKKESTISSSEKVLVDVKSLSHSDHIDLRKKALHIYLHGLFDALCGRKSIDDPKDIIRTVNAIYWSLHNSFMHGWREHQWRFKETTNVSISYCIM